MRIVFDTNVLLAAFATRGMCEALVAACVGKYPLFISDPILYEVQKNLVKKFKLPAGRAREIIDFLKEHFQLVSPQSVPLTACRDASDCVVLGTALACNADFLVTGDKDLLVLKQFQNTAILSPREFYDRLCNP